MQNMHPLSIGSREGTINSTSNIWGYGTICQISHPLSTWLSCSVCHDYGASSTWVRLCYDKGGYDKGYSSGSGSVVVAAVVVVDDDDNVAVPVACSGCDGITAPSAPSSPSVPPVPSPCPSTSTSSV